MITKQKIYDEIVTKRSLMSQGKYNPVSFQALLEEQVYTQDELKTIVKFNDDLTMSAARNVRLTYLQQLENSINENIQNTINNFSYSSDALPGDSNKPTSTIRCTLRPSGDKFISVNKLKIGEYTLLIQNKDNEAFVPEIIKEGEVYYTICLGKNTYYDTQNQDTVVILSKLIEIKQMLNRFLKC